MSTSRVCPRCGEEKPLDEFAIHAQKKGGRDTWCKLCKRAYNRAYHREHRERILKRQREYRLENIHREQDSQYRRRYGITLDGYDEILESQNNVCAVCGIASEENGMRLAVDHNHETGRCADCCAIDAMGDWGFWEMMQP